LAFSCRAAAEQLDRAVLLCSQEAAGEAAALAPDEVHTGFAGGAE